MPGYRGTVELNTQDKLRLDRYAARLGILSRSQLKARAAKALVNGKPVKLSCALKTGDLLELHWNDDVLHDLVPEDIPLDVLYEDNRVIVVNKVQGMVVHPAAGNWSGTLAHALLGRVAAVWPSASDRMRPFIVHRLDKDTSGVMIAAWDSEALSFLQAQFKARTVCKSYIALTRGAPREDEGRIAAALVRDPCNRKRFTVSETRGRAALTRFRVKQRWTLNDGSVYALIVLRPATGRTHQLRVHLRYIGCPILGDPVYNTHDKRFPSATLALHARRLTLVLPGSTAMRSFTAPVPRRFREFGLIGHE
ncbi:MAG: RluA family pseudouridine synthase [Spirochaetaceae bacterium]|jgi:23S rRNA pseudouridine1911/1915/1917 synthase|nr:RluA family pseudouridine synthase [Spirochaetaceae bacterium]